MANSIDLVTKFQAILDEIYKREVLTARMDSMSKPVNFDSAQVVKVFKTSLVGLGDYSRASGFPAGDVTGTWETLTLSKDRGRAFSVDAMDDEESLGMAFGTLVNEFIRTKVGPEIDAYRFSTYASWSGISSPSQAALADAAAVIAAIDVGQKQLDADEVPPEGRLLYLAEDIYHKLKGALTRSWVNESGVNRNITNFDNMQVVMVPQTRFYKGVTLDAGATSSAGGYSKTATTGRDLNFMIIHPSAVLQVAKHNPLRIFEPGVNQTADAWLFQYRIYHDAFVLESKVDGIYAHVKNS
jgi:hypothetical protein